MHHFDVLMVREIFETPKLASISMEYTVCSERRNAALAYLQATGNTSLP